MAREIYVENYEDNALTAATAVVLSDNGAAYGIRKKGDLSVVVAAGTATSNPSTGVYTYDIDALDTATEYEYCFKITRASGDIEYVTGDIDPLPNEDATESTLSLELNDLRDDVAHFLHGKDYDDCSAAQKSVIGRAIDAGYRQFLYPPAAEGIPAGYEWTFLRPVTSIDTTADDKDQTLPGDFGRLIEDGFTYEDDAQVPMVLADVGEGHIRKLRMSGDETGRPRVAAIRRRAGTGITGQRAEVMWYPTPDDAYTLYYRYEALVDALTVDLPYPLGGMKHAETIRSACIASADEIVNDGSENRFQVFLRNLAASIRRDMKEQRKFFGNVGCHGEYEQHKSSRGLDGEYTISISGDQIYPSS